MKIQGLEFPEELFYDENHYWLRVEEGAASMGIDAYTAHMAGEITHLDLPQAGTAVEKGRPLGSVESGKWVGRIYAPVSGTVAEVNTPLEDAPEQINDDPYAHWLCRIVPSALDAELTGLLRGEPLKQFIEAELARLEE